MKSINYNVTQLYISVQYEFQKQIMVFPVVDKTRVRFLCDSKNPCKIAHTT